MQDRSPLDRGSQKKSRLSNRLHDENSEKTLEGTSTKFWSADNQRPQNTKEEKPLSKTGVLQGGLPPKSKLVLGSVAALTLGIGILIIFLIGSGKEMSDEIGQIAETGEEKSESPEREEVSSSPLQAVNLYSPPPDLENLIDSSKDSVVQVWCAVSESDNDWYTGTGWPLLIGSEVLFITNHHVIEPCESPRNNNVDLLVGESQETGQWWSGSVIAHDKSKDLAIIRTQLKLNPFPTSTEAKVGHWVMAIGNPEDLIGSVNFGSVSNIGTDNLPWTGEVNLIYTDAAINSGNSGGPLLNSSGQAIGVITGGYNVAEYENIAFVVQISELCSRLLDCAKTPWQLR